jgi:hypothetical protein
VVAALWDDRCRTTPGRRAADAARPRAAHDRRIVGFVNGRESTPDRERDVWTIRSLVWADDREARAFWTALGFEAESPP